MLLDFWPDLQSAVFTARQVAVADWAVAMVDRVEVESGVECGLVCQTRQLHHQSCLGFTHQASNN